MILCAGEWAVEGCLNRFITSSMKRVQSISDWVFQVFYLIRFRKGCAYKQYTTKIHIISLAFAILDKLWSPFFLFFYLSRHCKWKRIFNCNKLIFIYIWVTFPSLHIEHKLITFLGSLGHFCDQIQNGTMKTKTNFLLNFLGRVRMCNHFLCRVIFLPPGR